MITTNFKKGIIYYRVSTEDQAQFGVSLEQQRKNCIEYAERRGIEILKTFHDDGVSAKTIDRPSLKELLNYCEKNYRRIDCLIVYKVDRLSRNTNDYTSILCRLNKMKIQLISTSESAIDETPSGKLNGNMMAAFAQFDNDMKSERVSACMMEKIKQGVWCWKAPIGYVNTLDSQNHKIIALDVNRSHLITWAFEKFATGIYPLEEVRTMVNKKGLTSWRGKEISKQTMYKIINNKFYIGVMTTGKEEYPGSHEKLTDEAIYYKCQSVLSGNSRGECISINRACEAFPLRHFVLCAYCGRPLTGYFSTGKCGGKYPYYGCYNKDCSSKKSIAKKGMEKDFVGYLKKITPKVTFLNSFKAVIIDVWQKKYQEINQARNYLAQKIDQLEEEKLKLIEMKKKELFNDEDFKMAFEKVKKEIADKQADIFGMKLESFNVDQAVSYVFDFIATIPEFWEQATYQQQIKLQSLIFPEKPIYDLNEFRTPVLSPILETKKELANANSSIVIPGGIEPPLQG